MNIYYESFNESKIKILRINDNKDNKEYKGNEYINEAKIKLKENRKSISKNSENKINMIQNKNEFGNKVIFLLKKNLLKNNFMIFIILLIKFIFIISKFNQDNFLFQSSEVTLKIKGKQKGNTKIISDNFFGIYNKCNIFLNDTDLIPTTNNIYLNNSEIIIVKINWNNEITTLNNMFRDCDSIIEIDLSKFNTSQINDMSYMFYNCSSLVSLNLSNFDTSRVIDMNRMFVKCSSLASLNLLNFDTSNVQNMAYMFYNCSLFIISFIKYI